LKRIQLQNPVLGDVHCVGGNVLAALDDAVFRVGPATGAVMDYTGNQAQLTVSANCAEAKPGDDISASVAVT
jgi:hypothetical protein